MKPNRTIMLNNKEGIGKFSPSVNKNFTQLKKKRIINDINEIVLSSIFILSPII